MISKNKHSPATLYLLNAKSSNKLQQQRKSARVTFNKKKSSRSISQFQKWNPSINKDLSSIPAQNGQLYLPSSRTNSQIKKIVLSRNQFGLDNLSIQKKLTMIIQIFQGSNLTKVPNRRLNTATGEQIEKQKPRKSQENKSDQISLLSLKQLSEKDFQKHSRSRGKISHMRTQSMITQTDHQNKSLSFQNLISKIQKKFKSYEKLSQEWRLRYSMQDGDFLVQEILKVFKSLFIQLVGHFTNHLMGNLQYFQESISSVSKEYEIQIASLREQITKKQNANEIINSLMNTINQKHCKGVICSKIFEDIQLQGTNIEHFIQNSQIFEEIKKISNQASCLKLEGFRVPFAIADVNLSKFDKNNSDEQVYEEEKLDYVENDSNWNQNFQNTQSIKGVLKYIHNHNQKAQEQYESNKNNLNSTSYLAFNKSGKNDMKIENWKTFDDRPVNQYKKVNSQR